MFLQPLIIERGLDDAIGAHPPAALAERKATLLFFVRN